MHDAERCSSMQDMLLCTGASVAAELVTLGERQKKGGRNDLHDQLDGTRRVAQLADVYNVSFLDGVKGCQGILQDGHGHCQLPFTLLLDLSRNISLCITSLLVTTRLDAVFCSWKLCAYQCV